MSDITWDEIYKEFCEWSPEHANMIEGYKPWGNNSIVVWFSSGHAYKVKRHAPGRFTMQMVSNEDINKKFGLNN